MTRTRLFSSFGATLAMCAAVAGHALAQDYAPVVAAPQTSPDETFIKFAPDQLDTLLGPIALYPDPLIAQILPASTYPIDIVRAARLVRSGATNDQIDQQNWDPSVKAVAHYPSIIEMMDQSIDWTQQLGQAFIAQPEDVMVSIQRLRQQAQSVGNLVTTSQQQVYVETDVIRIVPANPEIIYIPVYEPSIVYYQRPYYGSFISFGIGFPCGIWFDLDFDWHNHWCYRPGWTWNHWHDHFIIEREHFIRPSHDFEPHHGAPPPNMWHRDEHKPLTFPGRRLTSPSAFDHFRGRDHEDTRRPTVAPIPHPTNTDRGRGPETPRPTGVGSPNQSADHTRRALDRGQSSRQSEPSRVTPTPAPAPATPRVPTPPHNTPSNPSPPPPRTALPVPPRATTPGPSPAPAPVPHAAPPAPTRVNPSPVRIAPPPAAATRPPPPAYVQPPQKDDKSRSGGHR